MKIYRNTFPCNSLRKATDTSGWEFTLNVLQNSGFIFHWTSSCQILSDLLMIPDLRKFVFFQFNFGAFFSVSPYVSSHAKLPKYHHCLI